MNRNIVLSKSVDNQTTKIPFQSLQDRKKLKRLMKKQSKLISIHVYCKKPQVSHIIFEILKCYCTFSITYQTKLLTQLPVA